MTETQLVEWLTARGYRDGANCWAGWNKDFPSRSGLNLVVRYSWNSRTVTKERKLGFSRWIVQWRKPLEQLTIVDGKLTIKL